MLSFSFKEEQKCLKVFFYRRVKQGGGGYQINYNKIYIYLDDDSKYPDNS